MLRAALTALAVLAGVAVGWVAAGSLLSGTCTAVAIGNVPTSCEAEGAPAWALVLGGAVGGAVGGVVAAAVARVVSRR